MLTYIVSAVVIIAAIYSLILLLFLGLGRASAMDFVPLFDAMTDSGLVIR